MLYDYIDEHRKEMQRRPNFHLLIYYNNSDVRYINFHLCEKRTQFKNDLINFIENKKNKFEFEDICVDNLQDIVRIVEANS